MMRSFAQQFGNLRTRCIIDAYHALRIVCEVAGSGSLRGKEARAVPYFKPSCLRIRSVPAAAGFGSLFPVAQPSM
jgi:hypothetical protein